MKEIETRFTEVRETVSDLKKMLHKFTAKRVLRTWTENFVDDVTGEETSIERNEVLFERATFIDQDVLQKINFYMQTGDITSVYVKPNYLTPYIVSSVVRGKRYKFLLYAKDIECALIIAKDYIELNYSGAFYIRAVSDFRTDIIITDNLQDVDIQEENQQREKKFYQVEFSVTIDNEESIIEQQVAVVETTSVDRAMMLICDLLRKNERKRVERNKEEGLKDHEHAIIAVVEAVKTITIKDIVPREFSEAYI